MSKDGTKHSSLISLSVVNERITYNPTDGIKSGIWHSLHHPRSKPLMCDHPRSKPLMRTVVLCVCLMLICIMVHTFGASFVIIHHGCIRSIFGLVWLTWQIGLKRYQPWSWSTGHVLNGQLELNGFILRMNYNHLCTCAHVCARAWPNHARFP